MFITNRYVYFIVLLFISSFIDLNGSDIPFENNSLLFEKHRIFYDSTILSYVETITCFEQDHQGYVWIGTNSGAFRYNTETFGPYSYWVGRPKEHSLLNPYVNCMLSDSEGSMWFGTNGGLSRLDPWRTSYIHFTNDVKDSNSLNSNIITHLIENDDGTIWIGTDEGLNLLNKNTGTVNRYRYSGSGSVSITTMVKDENDKLWIGTESNGVLSLSDTASQSLIHPIVQTSGIRNINCIESSANGEIWIGTENNGVFQYNPNASQLKQYQYNPQSKLSILDNNVRFLFEDSGIIWVGTTGGLNRINPLHQSVVYDVYQSNQDLSLSSNYLTALYSDNTGAFWIGASNGVINRYDPGQLYLHSIQQNTVDKNSLSFNQVNAVCQDLSGRIWIGGQDHILNHYDPHTQSFTHYPIQLNSDEAPYYNAITSLAVSPSGKIWIGTLTSGLICFDPDMKIFDTVQHFTILKQFQNNKITSVMVDHDGNVWAGTENNGVFLINPDTLEFQSFIHDPLNINSLSSQSISILFEDSDGLVWIGTYGKGLNQFNPQTRQVTRLPFNKDALNIQTGEMQMYRDYHRVEELKDFLNQESNFELEEDDVSSIESAMGQVLKGSIIHEIFEDSLGNLWVGTNETLNLIDKDSGLTQDFQNEVTNYRYSISSIEEGKNQVLWISTNVGILRILPGEFRFEQFKNVINIQDHYNPNCSIQLDSGEFYFGGTEGITYWNEGYLEKESIEPPIVIFHIHVDKVPQYTDQNQVQIYPHTTSRVDFNFAALSYSYIQLNQYEFMLEGYDSNWRSFGKAYVEYDNLPPGEYRFVARGSNSKGVWNKTGTDFRFVITPPYWQEPWFQWFIAFTAFLIVVLIYFIINKSLINALRRTSAELETERDLSQNILDHSPSIVFIIQPDGKIIYINKSGEELVGSTGPYMNKYWWDISQSALEKEKLELFHQDVMAERKYTVELPLTLVQKETRMMNWQCLNRYDGHEKLIETYIFGNDITEQFENQVLEISSREQRNIGQEIHDSLCQSLTGVTYMCTSLLKDFKENKSEQTGVIADIRNQLQKITHQSKKLARGLYLHELDMHGLETAIGEMVKTAQDLFQTPCSFECVGELKISDMETSTHIYRLLQEALSNAVKYSKSKTIKVKVQSLRNQITLLVKDDGIGFDPVQYQDKGMGLNLMRFRARRLNGQFEIISAPGKGTEVVCIIPVMVGQNT